MRPADGAGTGSRRTSPRSALARRRRRRLRSEPSTGPRSGGSPPGPLVGHDQLGLGAPRSRTTPAAQDDRLDVDSRMAERRADHRRLDRRARARRPSAAAPPASGTTRSRASARHLSGAAARSGRYRCEQRGDERRIARQQMHRPAGALADEAARHAAGRVEPGVARQRAGSRAARAVAPRAARPRNRPAARQPPRTRPSRSSPRATGRRGRDGAAGRDMAGNVPGVPGRAEGRAARRGMTGGGNFYTFHRLFRNPGPFTQEPTWQSRS